MTLSLLNEEDNSDTNLVDVEDEYDGPLDYIDQYQVIIVFLSYC